MEKQSNLKWLATEEEFFDILKLDRAIIYLLVDWSGPERVSRAIIYKVLSDLDENGTPVFQIDCSDQTKIYVTDWLSGQQNDSKELNYGGCGETLLIGKGKILDFIKYPGQLGLEKVREKLTNWKYSH